jgi:hypothetical protein
MYIYTFLLRMTDTMTSENIDISSWDMLYMYMRVRNKFICTDFCPLCRDTNISEVYAASILRVDVCVVRICLGYMGPDRDKRFFSTEVHPTSYTMDTRISLPGSKAAGA